MLWHNLREEPVLYINGKPYVVREADQPFCNLEYTGIDRSRVEDMERRLKADVLAEAALFDGHILVTEEDDDMQVRSRPCFLCARVLMGSGGGSRTHNNTEQTTHNNATTR